MARLSNPRNDLVHEVGLNRFGPRPGQSEQHGAVGSVSYASGRKRPEQRDSEPGGIDPFLFEELREVSPRPHRSHGMGRGRTYTEGEHIEHAQLAGTCITSHAPIVPHFFKLSEGGFILGL